MHNSIKTRPLRAENEENAGLPPWQEHFLLYGEELEGEDFNTFEFIFWRNSDDEVAVWKEHGEALLEKWTREHPCTRPHAWWEHDAPKEPLAPWNSEYWIVKHAPLRQRIGGVGTPSFVLLGNGGTERGLPAYFVDEYDLERYEEWDDDLPPRETLRITEPLRLYDPSNPPLYESEAAYLQRHGLLTADELKWLEGHPEAMTPVVAEQNEIEDEDL